MTGALHSFPMTPCPAQLQGQSSTVWRASALGANAGVLPPADGPGVVRGVVGAGDAAVQSWSCLLGGRGAQGEEPAEEIAA